MATSADIYRTALAPYNSGAKAANVNASIQKIIDYNSKLNLGLTDDQIAAGIRAFGSRHVSQFGTGITGASNFNAVAAESVERALTLAGKDGGAFWNSAGGIDSYPVTSEGVLPANTFGAGYAAGRLRAHDNWNYSTGGNYATTDSLDKALNDWSQGILNPTFVFTGASNADIVGNATGQQPMYFSAEQRKATADTMRSFNNVLKLGLTEEDMVKGANQFAGAQYQIYNQGYNVGSDPYNIARWSLWNALNNKGKTDVGDSLIEKTNAKQALTATQAEELYNKANKWVDTTYTTLEEQMEKQETHGFFNHLKKMAPGVLTIASLFTGIAGLIGPAGGVAAASGTGALSTLAESLGLSDVFNAVSSGLDVVSGLGTDLAKGLGLSGDVAKTFATGIDSAISKGGMTALTGGDIDDILQSAGGGFLTSNLSNLTGLELKDLLKDLPTDFPIADILARTGAGGVGGTVNAWMNDRDLGIGATVGAFNGLTNGILKAADVPDFVSRLIQQYGLAPEVAQWVADETLKDQEASTPVPPPVVPPTTPPVIPAEDTNVIPPPPVEGEEVLATPEEFELPIDEGIPPAPIQVAAELPEIADIAEGRDQMFGGLPDLVGSGPDMFGGLQGGLNLEDGRDKLFAGLQSPGFRGGGAVRHYDEGGSVDDYDFGYDPYGNTDPYGMDSYIDYSYDYPGEPFVEQDTRSLYDMFGWSDAAAQASDPYTEMLASLHLANSDSADPFKDTESVNAGWSGETLGYKPAELSAYLRGTASTNPLTGRAAPVRSTGARPEKESGWSWGNGVAGALSALGKLYYSNKRNKGQQSQLSQYGSSKSAGFNAPLVPQGSLAKPVQALLSSLSQQSPRAGLDAPPPMYTPTQTAAARAKNAARRPVMAAAGGYIEEGGYLGGEGYPEEEGPPGSGQADDVPAMLSEGEYVWDAETVSMLGDGNNDAGAAALEQMRRNIRMHKRSAPPDRIAPPSLDPMEYLMMGEQNGR